MAILIPFNSLIIKYILYGEQIFKKRFKKLIFK